MRRLDWWLVTLVIVAVPAVAAAQPAPPAIMVAPLNILVPNYNGVAAGEVASLQANAFLARANDASSAFFNPAGLTLATQTSVSGSAGVYQTSSVTPENIAGRGAAFQQIPSLVGLVVPKLFGQTQWAGGFSLSRVNAWAQSTDLQRQFETPGGADRVQYSSASHLSGLLVNLGVGYAHSKKLRVGGTIDLQTTDSARSQSLAEQYVTGSGLSALLITSHGAAQLWHLRMTAGIQYEITPAVHVGAVVRTPGVRISQGGSYAYEGLLTSGPSTVTASFLDTDANVEYRLPLEFKAGIAWVGPRVRLEADLLSHAGGGRYDAIRTSQTWTLVTDGGQGTPPIVQRPPMAAPVVDSRAVTNMAIGGQVQLTRDDAWALYGGYATDRSPVGADDTTFTDADMQVFTAGISGKTSLVLGSVGVRYESGTTGDIMLRLMQNGQQVGTRLKISNLGIVYSVALRF